MKHRSHVQEQKEFYASGRHEHLRARETDLYAAKLASELARRSGMRASDRVLEVGAGFGRFTFHLLEHCSQVDALDLSPRALEALAETRDRYGIPHERCRTLCAEVNSLDLGERAGQFDVVVGFFILHHLPDVAAALASLARALRPGGCMVFLEPNRRNPLFLAQLTACPDMTWREEKGLFQLSARKVCDAYRAAGVRPSAVEYLGFFPPQIYNRFGSARRFERWLETTRWARPLLPFLLTQGRMGG